MDDDLVFLDIAADAYFCLPGGARAVVLEGRRGVAIGDPSLVGDFKAAGLIALATNPDKTHPPSPPALPRVSAVPLTTPRPRWSDLAPGALSVGDILLTYRGRPFSDLLRRAGCEAPRAPPRGAPAPALLDVVTRFQRWVPYAPVSGKCLLRSYMLLRLLRRSGHDATWVFGVSTWPFAAHCWLQYDDVALDESVELLAGFHPILAI